MVSGEQFPLQPVEVCRILVEVTPDICVGCQIPLRSYVTGRNWTPEGDCCDDCYYERLGALVEEFPITTPSIHR
jgi:hypothetical protein